MEKAQGSISLPGWSSLFAGLCCEKSYFCLAQPLGGCLELAFGHWLSSLMVADVCFVRESLCRIPQQGQNFYRRPTGATATRALRRVLAAVAWERHGATVPSPVLGTAAERGSVWLWVLCSVPWDPWWTFLDCSIPHLLGSSI